MSKSCSPIYASNHELSQIYPPVRNWLSTHGALEVCEGSVAPDTYGGLPIVEGPPPRYAFNLRPDKARQYAPAFAKIFAIGSAVELSYSIPNYQIDSVKPTHRSTEGTSPFQLDEGAVSIRITKPASSPLCSETIYLHSEDTTSFLIDRVSEERTPNPDRVTTVDHYGMTQGKPRTILYKECLGLVSLVDMLRKVPPNELKVDDWQDKLLRRLNDESQ